jgi:hypothetical protein
VLAEHILSLTLSFLVAQPPLHPFGWLNIVELAMNMIYFNPDIIEFRPDFVKQPGSLCMSPPVSNQMRGRVVRQLRRFLGVGHVLAHRARVSAPAAVEDVEAVVPLTRDRWN